MMVRGNTGPLTIPELRRAFESVDRFVAKKPTVAEFQRHWKKTFGKPVATDAARDYLQFASAKPQSGGSASLSYELGEPVGAAPNVPSYGLATPYVSTGFGFANVPGFINQCGTVDSSTPVPADMGSNLVGGKRSTERRKTRKQRGGAGAPLQAAFAEFMSRPLGMNSPPSMGQTVQTLSTGYNALASPRPEINDLSFTRPPSVFNATLPTITSSF
jgi:hypothetical protein